MKFSRISSMTFINENIHLVFDAKTNRNGFLKFFYIFFVIQVAYFTSSSAKLMNKRTHKAPIIIIEQIQKVVAAFRPGYLQINSGKNLFYLVIKLFAVGDDKYSCSDYVFQNPFCKPDHCKRFSRPLSMPDNTALISGKPFLAALDCIELIITADFFNTRIIDDKVMNYV